MSHLTPADLHVGQEVILWDPNWRRSERPRGTVTKIGRKLVTIRTGWGDAQYRIDSQARNDAYGGSFLTLEQDAASQQRTTDRATLMRHGFKLEWSARPSDEDLRRVAKLLEAGKAVNDTIDKQREQQ